MALLKDLQTALERRIAAGDLALLDTDLGETVGAQFFATLGTHRLAFTTSSALTEEENILRWRGTAVLFGFSGPQEITIEFVEIDAATLGYTLLAQAFPDDWTLAKAFPQLQQTFFEELPLKNTGLIATSYAHTLRQPAQDLAAGLNFYTLCSNTGSLQRLAQLGAFFDSFALSGTIVPTGSLYTISFEYRLPQGMGRPGLGLVLLGHSPITLSLDPVLTFSSAPDGKSGTPIARAYIRGTAIIPQFSFPAVLTLPIQKDQLYWQLEADQNGFDVSMGVSKVLRLSTETNLVDYFPASFLELYDLHIDRLSVTFLLAYPRMASVFTELELKPGVDGQARSWQILSTPKLVVGDFKWGLQTAYYEFNETEKQLAVTNIISGRITIGTLPSVLISIAAPLEGDWLLQVLPSNSSMPSLSDLASFAWAGQGGKHDQSAILNALPAGLVKTDAASPAIVLEELLIGFYPLPDRGPYLSFVSFQLAQGRVWKVLGSDLLQFSDWSIALKIDVKNSYAITGLVKGKVKIGSIANISANLPIPAGAAGWTLGLDAGTTIEVPALGNLLVLAGGSNAANGLPQGFTSFGAFTIDQLAVNFNPATPTLNWFRFNMVSREDWTVVSNFLVISNIAANLRINKSTKDYDASGYVSGNVAIGGIDVWVLVTKSPGQSWKLGLALPQPIHLPGLSDLAAWMLPAGMLQYIPEAFMPFGAGLDITELGMDFDLSAATLQEIKFALKNSARWQVIPQYLAVDDVTVIAKISKPQADWQIDYTHITAMLAVGAAKLGFTATKSTPDAPWVLIGSLQKAVSLDFNQLLQALKLDAMFQLPVITGLPVINVTRLTANVTPALGKFIFDGIADIDWTLPFLGLTLPLKKLGSTVDFVYLKGNAANYFKATVYGNLRFNSIEALLSLQLGSAGVDTIFTATLLPAQAAAIRLTQLADGMVATATPNTNKDQWSDLTPADLQGLAFGSAYLYFNYTQSKFFLYGSLKYGQVEHLIDAIFLTQEIGATKTRGYVFAFALADGFRFAQLFSALSIIDDFLQIKSGSVVINTYALDSVGQLKTELDAIVAKSDKPGTIHSPITSAGLPAGALAKGLHLYGGLNFGTMLFSRFLQLKKMNTGETPPDVTLFATIGSDSKNTVFQANFATFSILDTITFKGKAGAAGIMMRYTPASKNEFVLEGIIAVQALGRSYDFAGSLTVNNEQTNFKVVANLDQKIALFPAHLPPLFELGQLRLDLIYHFQTETRLKKYVEARIGGDFKALTIPLTAQLYLLDTTPVLAEIKLTSTFSMTELIGKLAPGKTWDPNFFDIKFLADQPAAPSRIYYYDQAADLDGKIKGFKAGYNLESTVQLTFLTTLTIALALQVKKDQGVVAHVGLLQPIDIFVLQIAGTQQESNNGKYKGGPTLDIDTTGAKPVFGFSGGLN
ncbi:MAG: hypothetical protein ABIQ93_16435, partial [Saprospiraceae bacterium]